MSYRIIEENEYATMRCHETAEYMYHTFHQPIGGEPFRNVMNIGLDYLVDHNIKRWLSDDRNNARLSTEDIEWSISDWGTRAAEAGWKYWALVVPESVAGRSGMIQIVQVFAGMGVKVRIFVDLEEARNWLLQQQ